MYVARTAGESSGSLNRPGIDLVQKSIGSTMWLDWLEIIVLAGLVAIAGGMLVYVARRRA
jgi:hypothetical protein